MVITLRQCWIINTFMLFLMSNFYTQLLEKWDKINESFICRDLNFRFISFYRDLINPFLYLYLQDYRNLKFNRMPLFTWFWISILYLYLQGVETQFYTFIYRNLQFHLILLYGVELLNLINPIPLYYQYLQRNITKK